jgi:hypothetical protein
MPCMRNQLKHQNLSEGVMTALPAQSTKVLIILVEGVIHAAGAHTDARSLLECFTNALCSDPCWSALAYIQ